MEVESNYYDPEAILAEETVSRRRAGADDGRRYARRRPTPLKSERRPTPTPQTLSRPRRRPNDKQQVVPCTFRYGVATLAKVLLPASHSRDVSCFLVIGRRCARAADRSIDRSRAPPKKRRQKKRRQKKDGKQTDHYNHAPPSCKPKTNKQLPRDSRVDLPLWLAKPLAERHIAGVALPGAYGERMRRRAAAGAECVDLRPHPHYYSAGLRLAPLVGDALVAAYLRQTFAERYRALLADSLRAPDGGALHEATKRLNEEERALFSAGREGAAAQEAWWARGGRRACKAAPPPPPERPAPVVAAVAPAQQRQQQQQQQQGVGAKRKAAGAEGGAGGGGGGGKRAAEAGGRGVA